MTMTTQAILRDNVKISEGATTAALLALLMLSVTGSVASANWTDGLGILLWAALGGLAIGMLISKVPLRGWIAHPLMLFLGLLAAALLPTFLLPNSLTFQEKLLYLATRFQDWAWKVISGGIASDNLIFVIQLAFLTWVLAELAAWFVYRRHQVWGAILMTGAAITLNLFYAAPQTGLYLGLFLLSALLLLVRMNLHALERYWRGAAIGYAADIVFDFFQYGILFSLMLMFLAWLLPNTAPEAGSFFLFDVFQSPWQGVEDQFTRVFSSLRPVERRAASIFFGSSLTLGGPINLGQRPVLDIQTNTGRYWRATVFDRYTGGGWINTHTDTLALNANDPRLIPAKDALRIEVTQTYKILLPDQNNLLFAEPQPTRFDLPTEIRYGRPGSNLSEFGMDLAFVRPRRPLHNGDSYTAVSAMSSADEDSLRAVPQNYLYPAWFAADYLQLPDRLPRRVPLLAKSITEEYSNPFDKASAIERYLRSKIKYNEAVTPPPSGRDGVDYTLFDRPEGYCNYYASAMAVLARSIGIPARIASGYTLGDYDNGVYHVTEKEAHAWPELYFPGYGWIEFEPTAIRPEIVRPKKPGSTSDDPNSNQAADSERKRQINADLPDEDPLDTSTGIFNTIGLGFGDPLNIAIVGTGLIGLAAIGTLSMAQWKRAQRMARLAPAARVYEEMLSRARWLGVGDEDHTTPFERADAISRALPQARRSVARVAAFYAREQYGAWSLNPLDRALLSTAWGEVRAAWWRSFMARIVRLISAAPFKITSRVHRVWYGSHPNRKSLDRRHEQAWTPKP